MYKLLLAALPVLIALAVACSDDDEPSSPSPTPPAQVTLAPSPNAVTSTPSGASPTPASTVPPVDGTVFPQNPGSTEPTTIKSNPDPVTEAATLVDVRVGAHPESGGWDRIVFEFEDVRPAGLVEYVDEAANCGSGNTVTLPGEAILAVRFDATNAHNEQGQLTIDATEVNGPGNIIVKAVGTCDFEAVVSWAIGLKSMKNYKVSLLENPARVVVDVKW
jgi:hypothetical protein